MAAGDIHLNSDGTIALDATGKIRIQDSGGGCDDCCGGCTFDGVDCTNCDDADGTPSQYEVTFDSVTLCGCQVGGTDYSFIYEPNGGWDINDAFTLTQVSGSPCKWELLLSSQMTLKSYFSSETCSGTPDETTDCDVRITLIRNTSDWTLSVSVEPSGGVAVGLFDLATPVDADTSGADELCATISNTFSNDYTTCVGIVDEPGHATGGTATVICL